MNKTELDCLKRELAVTLIRYGVNIKSPKIVEVISVVDDIQFTNMVVEELYKTGVKRVLVNWVSSSTARLHYLYGDKKVLTDFFPYELDKFHYHAFHYIPRVFIESEYFDALEGTDFNKVSYVISKQQEEAYRYIDKVFDAHWTGCFIPNKNWAKKLFPKLKEEDALNKAWKVFLKVTRVEKNKTLNNWKNHLNDLKKKGNYLTKLHIDKLTYKNKLGTNLTIGLTDNPRFVGGVHLSNYTHREYNPNFPTEEVFTTPHRLKADGVVYSSKPLCVKGELIEGIKMVFRKGKIVEAYAKKNQAILRTLIKQDKDACYLGEVALVPYSSLINHALPLFYSTIFDENACCHLAFGTAFEIGYLHHEKFSKKQLIAKGLNLASNTHIDFMIGTSDLSIIATTKDKKKITIFKNGEWAI